jgi:hypothetical protein
VSRIAADAWRQYSPDVFLTPPFPGFPSWHATATGAASRTLELFTGRDRYGVVAFKSAGYMAEPDASSAQMQARAGRAARDVPESKGEPKRGAERARGAGPAAESAPRSRRRLPMLRAQGRTVFVEGTQR